MAITNPAGSTKAHQDLFRRKLEVTLKTNVWSVTWTHQDDDNNYGTLLFLEHNSAVFVAGSFDDLPGYRTRIHEHHLGMSEGEDY